MLLSGLDSVCVAFALAKYCEDDSGFSCLIESVLSFTKKYSVDNDWRLNPDEDSQMMIKRIVILSIYFLVLSPRCGRCHGVGMVGHKVCKTCDGSGMLNYSNRKMAEYCDINRMAWLRVWKDRFNVVYGHVQDIESKVNLTIHRRYIDVPF
jgi:hypothetical protein